MLLNRDRANAIMDREGLDALVAVTDNNVYYLSDYETDLLYDPPYIACAILPRREDIEPCLVITEIDIPVIIQQPTWMPDLRTYYFELFDKAFPTQTFNKDAPLTGEDAIIYKMVKELDNDNTVGLFQAVIPALREKGLTKGKIGFDDTRFAGFLGDVIKDVHVVDAANLFVEIRMVKTPAEQAILREAARRNQKCIEKAIGAVKEGVLWQDVYTTYEMAVAEQQARVFAVFNGAGRRSAGAGRPNRDYPIKRGDMVCFDCMLKYKRYMGDIQRTVSVGEPPEKLARYWQALKLGVDEAYAGIRPGVSTKEIRDSAIETVRKAGIPDFEVAFIHSIGLDHLEVPAIAGGSLGLFQLEKDMVINIDMEVHEIGYGGVFFEESMLITDNGAERLYSLPRELIQV